MLPKENRLRRRKKIEEVLSQGRVLKGRYHKIFYLPSLEEIKVGIVVSKKVSKKAVERNKVKRRIREIWRRFLLSKAKKGYYLVIAYPSSLEATFWELKEDLEIILKENELL